VGELGARRAQGNVTPSQYAALVIHLDTSFLVIALVRGSETDQGCGSGWAATRNWRSAPSGWAEFLCGPVDPRAIASQRGSSTKAVAGAAR